MNTLNSEEIFFDDDIEKVFQEIENIHKKQENICEIKKSTPVVSKKIINEKIQTVFPIIIAALLATITTLSLIVYTLYVFNA